MLKLVVLVALAGLVASETPTAPQRANLKLAHDEYRKNTKTSFITAEPLYKKAVVDFSETLGAGHFFTKASKKRYNFLLAMDSSKLATEQAFACEDSCSPGGTYTGTGDVAGCTANYCDMYKVGADRRNWCSSSASTAVQHNYALEECQKTCGICVGNRQVGKTPYAASELSIINAPTVHDQCSDGKQNGDETGVDCGGSCACCGVDCVSSETTCTCTPACGNTCKCTDTITITTPAAGCGQACPSATVRTFTGATCPTCAPYYSMCGNCCDINSDCSCDKICGGNDVRWPVENGYDAVKGCSYAIPAPEGYRSAKPGWCLITDKHLPALYKTSATADFKEVAAICAKYAGCIAIDIGNNGHTHARFTSAATLTAVTEPGWSKWSPDVSYRYMGTGSADEIHSAAIPSVGGQCYVKNT